MAHEKEQQRGLIPRGFFNFPSWEDVVGEIAQLGQHDGLSIYEDKTNVYVEAALPGLKSNDIDVTLERGILHIKGEKKEEEEDKDKKFYRKATSSFSYRVALPSAVDESSEPKATYKDGIMKITFAKSKQSQGKKIEVQNN